MNELMITNSLSGKKEVFNPIEVGKVSFYVCGVTVYDRCHIGHARAYVVYDMMRRYLEARSYDVTYIQNFTDIDDKIIVRAMERNISIDALTEEMIAYYFEDMDALNIKRASAYPRATQYISKMIDMIQVLIDKGHAYVVSGEVFFEVDTFEQYGELSKKVLEELEKGARVATDNKKKNPLDFVLWKPSKTDEPEWDSPWGKGRPGWHIECSVMSIEELGENFDIHGGGEDLRFPHHENEIAQSVCATNASFANYWVHNGFVTIKKEKMSKSLKNFITIREVLKKYSGEDLRFYLLKTHYRKPLHFSLDGLSESHIALQKLYRTLQDYNTDEDVSMISEFQILEQRFYNSMNDNFNAAEAIGVLFDINKEIYAQKKGASLLLKLGEILGLFFNYKKPTEFSKEIWDWVEKRNLAKKEKDFQEADRIRDFLKETHHILIEDTSAGAKLRRMEVE